MENIYYKNLDHKELYKGDKLIWKKPEYIIWTGGTTIWTNGAGTIEDPYLIESPEHFSYLSYIVYTNHLSISGKSFKQMIDIDLNNIEWIPIGGRDVNGIRNINITFLNCNYDGNNKKIKNIFFKLQSSNIYGLFGYISNSIVKNLKVVNINNTINFEYVSVVGGIIGVLSSSIIDNCHVLGKSTLYGAQVGGVVSGVVNGTVNNKSIIINCSTNFYTTVICKRTATGMGGGIVANAESYTLIEKCVNKANVKSIIDTNGQCGGILSSTRLNNILNEPDILIKKCCNIGTINNSVFAAGIIAVQNNTIIENCTNIGTISGTTYSAGISSYIGSKNNEINSCGNLGVCEKANYNSGIVSRVSTSSSIIIRNSYNKGYIFSKEGSTSAGIIALTQSGSNINIYNTYNDSYINTNSIYSRNFIGSLHSASIIEFENIFSNKNKSNLDFIGSSVYPSYNEFNINEIDMINDNLSTLYGDVYWEYINNKTPIIKLII